MLGAVNEAGNMLIWAQKLAAQIVPMDKIDGPISIVGLLLMRHRQRR